MHSYTSGLQGCARLIPLLNRKKKNSKGKHKTEENRVLILTNCRDFSRCSHVTSDKWKTRQEFGPVKELPFPSDFLLIVIILFVCGVLVIFSLVLSLPFSVFFISSFITLSLSSFLSLSLKKKSLYTLVTGTF